MKPNINTKWPQAIRQNIFQLILLNIVLGVIAIGFISWYQFSVNKLHYITNDFHQASSKHLLKALEEVRHIKFHILSSQFHTYVNESEKKLLESPIEANHKINHRVSFYLIQQEISSALQLQHLFNDHKFASISNRLERRLSNFVLSNKDYLLQDNITDYPSSSMNKLIVPLMQLERLHSVKYTELMTQLNTRKEQQVLVFYILITIILLAGIIITRHGLKAINILITDRKEQEDHILHQAHYDTLTKLPNRFLSLDRLLHLLTEMQRKKEQVAVLFIDLDDFKKINDTLGHETGDKILIEAGQRLLSVVRGGDTVGRLGGDEFIILLTGIHNATDAIPVVENLLEQFREAFNIDSRELILTASIGIAVFPEDGNNPSELLRNADSAMYHSKELGRNTYSYFTDAMNQKVSRRLILEEQMHGALDRGEFYVLYQPQVDISNSRIIGVEALLRWNNPVLGNVFPDEFITVSEQTGLIISLGEFVLTKSLALTAQWQKINKIDFRIAVNLSPRQFRDPGLVIFVESAINESGISAECLKLEITEGVLMSGHAYIDDALSALNKLGIELSMDDFGTGYSSLSYLRKYPFTTLKIDRSFINDITIDSADKELVNATIVMAHSLGLKVVAEGVETKEQLAHLKTQGCEYAQGYYFSRPVSPEKITEMLEGQCQSDEVNF